MQSKAMVLCMVSDCANYCRANCYTGASSVARDSQQGLLQLPGHGAVHGLQLLWLPHGPVCHRQW